MSRYESSKFVRDPKVMNKDVLAQACDKLGWKYVLKGDDLLITDLGGREKLHGEFALKVSGDTVTYNSYNVLFTSCQISCFSQTASHTY